MTGYNESRLFALESQLAEARKRIAELESPCEEGDCEALAMIGVMLEAQDDDDWSREDAISLLSHGCKVAERLAEVEAERDEALDRWNNAEDANMRLLSTLAKAKEKLCELEAERDDLLNAQLNEAYRCDVCRGQTHCQYQLCDDCMTRVNGLEAELAEARDFARLLNRAQESPEDVIAENKRLVALLGKCATCIRSLGCEPSAEVSEAIAQSCAEYNASGKESQQVVDGGAE